MGNHVMSVYIYLYMCPCIYLCVDMYMCVNMIVSYMFYDCFMYVHMCTYCICMYVMTMYSAVRIPLVLNCAI